VRRGHLCRIVRSKVADSAAMDCSPFERRLEGILPYVVPVVAVPVAALVSVGPSAYTISSPSNAC